MWNALNVMLIRHAVGSPPSCAT